MTRVLYIGGLGRSGTTLLERILGELPTACALGEVVHLWRRGIIDNDRCGCGTPFGACPFWTQVGDRAFGGWGNLDVPRVLRLQESVERTRYIPRLAARRAGTTHGHHVMTYAAHYARLYAAAAAVSDAQIVLDSSKHSALAYCLAYAADLDLRVVHMVRDSRGVAYSWTKTVARPETDGQREMHRYAPGRAALLWNAHNAALGLLRHRGVPVLRLRYEELLADPAAAARRVAAFAGIDPGPLDFLDGSSVRLGTGHSVAGNPMRFATGEVPLRHDDAWRAGLRPAHRVLVGALTAPLLTAYGYGRR